MMAAITNKKALRNKEGMMPGKQGSPIEAVRAIFDALEPLDEATRARALASAMSLLGMGAPTKEAVAVNRPEGASRPETDVARVGVQRFERPQSLIELAQDKNPVTNPQRIALFAFYRERVQSLPRFSRRDLEHYFADARFPRPANYDRDFNVAVQQGWIHESGDESYLTTKGIEAVEAGFAGKRSPTARTRLRRKGSRAPTRAARTAKSGRSARKTRSRKGPASPRRR